jgi:UDP-glucose 4-epimerase
MEYDATPLEIFHIGAREEITIKELVRETGRYFGYDGPYEIAPTYPGSVERRCPDISKAQRLLGYDPKIDWRDGLKLTLDWYVRYYKEQNPDGTRYFDAPDKFYKT